MITETRAKCLQGSTMPIVPVERQIPEVPADEDTRAKIGARSTVRTFARWNSRAHQMHRTPILCSQPPGYSIEGPPSVHRF